MQQTEHTVLNPTCAISWIKYCTWLNLFLSKPQILRPMPDLIGTDCMLLNSDSPIFSCDLLMSTSACLPNVFSIIKLGHVTGNAYITHSQNLWPWKPGRTDHLEDLARHAKKKTHRPALPKQDGTVWTLLAWVTGGAPVNMALELNFQEMLGIFFFWLAGSNYLLQKARGPVPCCVASSAVRFFLRTADHELCGREICFAQALNCELWQYVANLVQTATGRANIARLTQLYEWILIKWQQNSCTIILVWNCTQIVTWM